MKYFSGSPCGRLGCAKTGHPRRRVSGLLYRPVAMLASPLKVVVGEGLEPPGLATRHLIYSQTPSPIWIPYRKWSQGQDSNLHCQFMELMCR